MTSTAAPPVSEGFDAMGHPIPLERRESAYRALRDDIAPEASAEECQSLVERVADHLERDQPYKAMEEATDAGEYQHGGQPGLRLDVTGAYRLLAHLLAAPVGSGS
jgi:hypothetical protein